MRGQRPLIVLLLRLYPIRLAWWLAAFVAGVSLGVFHSFNIAYAAAIVGGLILFYVYKQVKLAALALIPVFLFAGLSLSTQAYKPDENVVGDANVTAMVRTMPSERKSGEYAFDATNIIIDGQAIGDAYVYVSNSSVKNLLPGDRVSFDGTVSIAKPAMNPGGFDTRAWLVSRGDTYQIYSKTSVKLVKQGGASLVRLAAVARLSIKKHIENTFGDESRFLSSLLIGEAADADSREQLARLGISHIIAVSGLHVGFLYIIINTICSWLRLPRGIKTALLVAVLLVYAFITGLTASVIRASLMLLYIVIGQNLLRRPNPLVSVALAAFVILLYRPGYIMSAGFRLSFMGTLGIIFLYEPLLNALKLIKPRIIRQSVSLSVSAQIGTIAPMCAMNGYLPLLSLPCNIIVVMLAGLIFPLSAAALALSYAAPRAAAVAAFVPRMVTRFIVWSTATLSNAAPLMRIPGNLSGFIAIAFMILCVIAYFNVKRVAKYVLGVVAVAVLLFPLASESFMPSRFVQLSVGQQLSGVLHTKGNVTVFDTATTGAELINYLMYTGKNINRIIITHGHEDHFGGLSALIGSDIRIGEIYVSSGVAETDDGYIESLELAELNGIPVRKLSTGDVLSLGDGAWFETLWPPTGYAHKDANETSIVGMVHVGGKKLLVTGDIGEMEPLRDVDCDVLCAAHHGSRYSTSDAFIRQATPMFTIVSCSGTSEYLPSPYTLERFAAHGIDVYRTDELGAVTVYFGGGSLEVVGFVR